MVSLDIDAEDELIRAYYFEKIQSLMTILKSEYLPEVILDEEFELPEGKIVSRVYVLLNEKVSINNKKDWPKVKAFFDENMHQLELFWLQFKDFITS